MPNENEDPSRPGALRLAQKKRPYVTHPFSIHPVGSLQDSSGADPLVHYGRHFGWTVHAMCSIHALIVTGLLYAAKIGESDLSPDEVLDNVWVLNVAADHSILRTDK
jgi:hypothetical protein